VGIAVGLLIISRSMPARPAGLRKTAAAAAAAAPAPGEKIVIPAGRRCGRASPSPPPRRAYVGAKLSVPGQVEADPPARFRSCAAAGRWPNSRFRWVDRVAAGQALAGSTARIWPGL